MQVLVVQKAKRQGLCHPRRASTFQFPQKHTHKQSAVCLVDESKLSASVGKFVDRFRKQPLPIDIPAIKSDRVTVSSWSIIRTFLKREPRFRKLSRRQQLNVLRLGMQYKKTTVRSMQDKVDELFKKWSLVKINGP